MQLVVGWSYRNRSILLDREYRKSSEWRATLNKQLHREDGERKWNQQRTQRKVSQEDHVASQMGSGTGRRWIAWSAEFTKAWVPQGGLSCTSAGGEWDGTEEMFLFYHRLCASCTLWGVLCWLPRKISRIIGSFGSHVGVSSQTLSKTRVFAPRGSLSSWQRGQRSGWQVVGMIN